MKIKFKEKPSEELLERFTEKVKYFLQSQNLEIKIELWDMAFPMESYIDSRHTCTTYFWIKDCLVKTPKTKDYIKVRLLKQGIDKDIKDEHIWSEAAHIQDQLYSYLKQNPGNPKEGDLYWDLWKYHL